DRQASHLNVSHIASDLLEVLILETIFDVLSHDVAHLGVRALPLANTADRNVAIGDHTYQVIFLADREHAGIQTGHGTSSLLDRFFRSLLKSGSRARSTNSASSCTSVIVGDSSQQKCGASSLSDQTDPIGDWA